MKNNAIRTICGGSFDKRKTYTLDSDIQWDALISGGLTQSEPSRLRFKITRRSLLITIKHPLDYLGEEAKAFTRIKLWGSPVYSESDDVVDFKASRYKGSFKINSESTGTLGRVQFRGTNAEPSELNICAFFNGEESLIDDMIASTGSLKAKGGLDGLKQEEIPLLFGETLA
ncbi:MULTISPECIES: hypothetical protein [Aphanothece]|uniref:hypothetical protein n=1 Tax=Aphanothece TaxID=1121 RepID=UPI0039848642